MATSEQNGDERWEKMMKVLDRLEDRMEAMVVGQHRLQKQADRVAAAARKAQEREFLTVARTETAVHDMFDEMSAEKVVWDAEVLFDYDSQGLLQRLAQGEGGQMHNNCEQDVVSDAPWMLVGMSHQASTHPVFSEMGLKVAWDEEMQSETHLHEGLLKQLAQGGEDLEESASKDADVEDEASRPDPPSEATADGMNGGSMEELPPASAGGVLANNPEKEQNAEDQVVVGEVEDVGTKARNIDATSASGILSPELAPESINEINGAGEIVGATEVDDHEQEAAGSDILEAMTDDENEVGNDSKDVDDDEGEAKGSDFVALAALLKVAADGSSYGDNTFVSQDGSRIFTMERHAGLGSSAPSLRQIVPRQPVRSNLFDPSELAVTADPTEEMTEEEKMLHDKVELIKVQFLRLVYRLGANPEEMVAAQVLYCMRLAEGIRHGRQTNRAFSLDNARRKALLLEAEGKEDLKFSCNILVLGKTGVGKSATINSIFGEEKSRTYAFRSTTTNVREIVGDVDGVKIRIIDIPGLRPNVLDQGSNRKVFAAVKKYTKKCPPDIVIYVDLLDSLSHDLNYLPLLKAITAVLGSSIWFNAIVTLTHVVSGVKSDESKDVIKQYISVTGTPSMSQQFATAYHQGRGNYRDEADVDDVHVGFDEHNIPYVVLWLDIEHTDGKRYFTWGHSVFPNPEEMQGQIAEKGSKMVTIKDPNSKRDSSLHLHQVAIDKRYYVKDANENDYDGWFWPGSSSYHDMLNPEIWEWWAFFARSQRYSAVWIIRPWNPGLQP